MFRKSEVVTSSLPQKVGKKVGKKVKRAKKARTREKIEREKKNQA